MFTKIKICKNGVDTTSNGCCYAVMGTWEILCLRQGQDEPTETYYQRFEAAISAYVLSKCTSTKHVELNKTYVGVVMTMAPRGFRLCASSCQTIINKAKEFSMT